MTDFSLSHRTFHTLQFRLKTLFSSPPLPVWNFSLTILPGKDHCAGHHSLQNHRPNSGIKTLCQSRQFSSSTLFEFKFISYSKIIPGDLHKRTVTQGQLSWSLSFFAPHETSPLQNTRASSFSLPHQLFTDPQICTHTFCKEWGWEEGRANQNPHNAPKLN